MTKNKKEKEFIENFVKHEKTIVLDASMSGYYSAIQTISDMINTGKTLTDIDVFCQSALTHYEMLKTGTHNLYQSK